ncbi:hypothetical protein QJQ45_024418 [Haematococcus lacustris]|nr:hypothetical protein QJQ45_024418 [Haematococcus lacustris]
MVELHQRQRAAFQQQQQELERQLRQQNDTVLMLQQQLQASEKARAQMQKQMLQQEQQVKKQMEQLSASVASLLEEAGKPAAPATTTSKGQKRGRSGKQVDHREEATVWRPCNYADGNAVVKKFTPEQADQWREAVLEMGVAMTSLPGHLIPTSQLEWALQLLSLVFGYAIFNDIPLTESYGWPVISEGELDVRYSTGQRLQMPFTTANADGSLPDDVSMSGCWTARSLRIIRTDQAMAAQQDAAGEAARTRLKQYATAVRLARPYLRQLQQHASQLSQVTLRGGTVLTNDTMHGRDVNSVGMALTKAAGLVAAEALHVDVNPDPSLSIPPPTAAAAAAAAAPQTSSPPSHAVPSISAPAASSAATPTAPPRFIWGRDGLVMIIAVGVTQVLVSPGSHVQVLKVEKKHKGEISARVLKTAMKAMPKMQVYRVTLQPGEVLGMRGYTVHAGDWGLPDKASTRVHLYGSEGYINNATCFLSMLDVEFVHKCQPTSPPQRREQYDHWPPGLGPLHGGLYVQPQPYERPARAPVDTLWNSDWALSDEHVEAELTSLLGHWDESMAAEAAEEAEKEKKKGKKVVVAEVTEEAQETEEAGGKEAGDEEARKKKQGRKSEAPPFQPPDSLLWLRLRVAYIGTVWRLRSSGAATTLQPQMVAQRVAEEVVLTLSSAVKRDWHRVGRDIRVGLCGAVPSTWFRGTDPELGADQFDRLWPEPSGGWFAKEGAEERALERVGGGEAGGLAGARQREERAFGAGAYVQRLEAACHLLHRGIERATDTQTASSCSSAAASPTPSAPGSISAGELCTLLLTDQEVLDVVLALHDIRAAQLCHLLSWPGSHALKLPPPSAALAQQLNQSQWSVTGSRLLSFVSALERDHDNSLEGDPLLRVWDSMHRAMLLVLAALQSLPIRPHPQHPDPAAFTHTSTTTQLPPGYHRCSACLLLSLRLVLSLAHHCVEDQLPNKDLALARLHGTLPGLLLGLSTSGTVMQAAVHPEAQAQRSQFLRCMLQLGPLVIFNVYEDITHFGQDVIARLEDKVTTSCPDQLARLLASSPVVTGWPGALPRKPSPMDSSTAQDSPGLGRNSSRCSSNIADPAAVNAYAHLAQALCAVLGRQEEELGITCQAEGRPGDWKPPAGRVDHRLLRQTWSQQRVPAKGKEYPEQGYERLRYMRGTWLACVQTLSHLSLAAFGSLLGNKKPRTMSTHSYQVQVHACIMYAGPGAWSMSQQEITSLTSTTVCASMREWHCARYIVRLLEAASAPSRPGAVTTLGPSPSSPSASSSSLLTVILSVLSRSLVVFQACVATFRLAVTTRSVTCPGVFPGCIRECYFPLCHVLGLMVELWPDQRCRPAMLRVLARSAVAGAHAYMTLVLLLDGAPDHGSEPRSLSGIPRTPELEQTFSLLAYRVCHMWILLLAPPGRNDQLSGIRSNDQCGVANDMQKVLHQPPSAQQLAPLALDLVWGMEGMLQMTQQHWRMFETGVAEEVGTNTFSFFASCGTSLDLFGRVIEVLAAPSVVGPAGLAAQPASWLPCGNSLVEGWCTRLLDRVCHLLCITSSGFEGSLEHKRTKGCWALANSHSFMFRGQQQAPPSMSPEAERLLACLTLVLTVALPLDTWLAVAPSLPAAEVKVMEQASAIHDTLARMEPEQVWSWQALAAGTPAEASLANLLALPAKGKEHPGMGYKRLRNRPGMACKEPRQAAS